MFFWNKIVPLFFIILFNGFFSRTLFAKQIDFFICSVTENKSQYAVIRKNISNEGDLNERFEDNMFMEEKLTPFFIAKGYPIPEFCEEVDLDRLTVDFPILKRHIDQFLIAENATNNQEPLIVILPSQLTNSDSINKVRPVIIATTLTFAVLWVLGSSFLAPGCLMVFITCAFRPEQCQMVLDNFSNFFSELWAKSTKQVTGRRLSN